MMESKSFDVDHVDPSLHDGRALLRTEVLWKSPLFENGNPFLEERTTIVVHPLDSGVRKIDFGISLKALVPEVSVGGSEDVKGYGGFCTRVKLPPGMVFASSAGAVTPTEEQLVAGGWMDISTPDTVKAGGFGLAILCHPTTPNYPAPWILRQTRSMQNIVYPGRDSVGLSMNQSVILRYRLIIHDGSLSIEDLSQLQSDYESIEVVQ
jgi:hypothetical protein